MTQNSVTGSMLGRRIDCALGKRPCDVKLTNLRLLDVMNGRIVENAEIFIDDGRIVDAGAECSATAKTVIDCRGGTAVPGLIDAHVHVESSLVTPVHFARMVAPFGTTTLVADPHEIANVLGTDGIRFMLDEGEKAEIDITYMLPSCVPSTPFETAGARLTSADLAPFLGNDAVGGLAELMNVPGVLAKDPDLLAKAASALNVGKRVDGHSPLFEKAALSAYAACGVTSDHEASTAKELSDRLSRGMTVLMREGSAAQNVAALAKAVTPYNSRYLCLCTDDSAPDDVLERGHINYVIRRAVECGIDPIEAIRMATVNTAQHFGFRDKGVIAPSYIADIAVFEDLKTFKVSMCFKNGKLVAENGRMTTPEPALKLPERVGSCVRIKPVTPETLTLTAASGKARVIGLTRRNLITESLVETVKTREDGTIDCSDNPGLVKLVVVERHHASGKVGVGLLRGFVAEGEKLNGAVASTVAHDSHNIVVAGDNDADILAAISAVETMQGGFVLVRDGKVVQSVKLEVAGLMSSAGPEKTAKAKRSLINAAHEVFHIPRSVHPTMSLSFLSLAVIPHLRVTDLGLFDVDAFALTTIEPKA